MGSEAVRAAIRVSSSYARQVATLAIGLVLVAVQVQWLGKEAFGLIMLVGATVGLAGMVEDLVRQSLVRELGVAHHGAESGKFQAAYNAALVICAAMAALCAVIFGGIIAAVRLLEIPDEFVFAGRVMIGAEGVVSCVTILTAPATNMYKVHERFVADNFWQLGRRFSGVAAALVLWKIAGVADPAAGIIAYGLVNAALQLALIFIALGIIVASDRRLWPKPSAASASDIREIFGTFGWNTGVIVGMNMYERVPALIMNVVFGLAGNLVYGPALILSSYVRMLTMGVNFGLDAVATRVAAAAAGNPGPIVRFMRQYTRLHAFVAAPGAVGCFVLADVILLFWLGPRMEQSEEVLPQIATMVRIMVVPLTVRSIADCWIRILYGAGYVRRYAPLILVGGLLNPVAGVALLLVVPDEIALFAPALAFALVFSVFHAVALPILVARLLHVRFWDVVGGAARPMAIATACAPLLVVPYWLAPRNPVVLIAAAALYGGAYVALCAAFAMNGQERSRVRTGVVRRLKGSRRDANPPQEPVATPEPPELSGSGVR